MNKIKREFREHKCSSLLDYFVCGHIIEGSPIYGYDPIPKKETKNRAKVGLICCEKCCPQKNCIDWYKPSLICSVCAEEILHKI